MDRGRLVTDEQGLSDLTVGQAARQQPKHLLLAGRQTHAEIVPATGLRAEVDTRPARESGDGRKQRFRAESRRGVGRRTQGVAACLASATRGQDRLGQAETAACRLELYPRSS